MNEDGSRIILTQRPTVGQTTIVAFFDDLDTFYLANTFTVKGLQHQIAASLRAYPWLDWYDDLISCCYEALRWKRASQPKSKPRPGAKHLTIGEIKAKYNLADYAMKYTALKKSGNKLAGLCPFHQEKTPSFFVYPDQQRYYCFSCQRHGDIIAFVRELNGLTVKEALIELSR